MVFTDEAVLISELKSGSEKAVQRWYKESQSKLKSFFGPKVTQSPDVEELVHDTYLSCLASLPLFRGTSGLFTWMMSIAKHELADYYRKKYAKRVISALPFGDELLRLSSQEEVFSNADVVTQVLKRLPASTAELLALKYIDGMSLKELADKFDVGITAMQSKLYRAKLAFQCEYKEIVEQESI